MMYDPKSIINKEEHVDPFETQQEGLDWFINNAKKHGYEAEVTSNVNISGTTRFAVSQVTQHTDLFTVSFNLKLVDNKKLAQARTTLIGPKGYEELFSAVERSLEESPDVSFYQGLPNPRKGQTLDASGKEWTIEERADAVIESVNAAEEVNEDVILAGTATSSTNYSRIVSTQGIDVETASSNNYFKVNAIVGPPDGRGYGQQELYWRYSQPNYSDLATEATNTALDTLDLKTLEAKEYEVLLGPKAVSDLIVFILFSSDPTSYHETNSYASDQLGAQVFDDKLTIHDSPRDPKQATISRSYDSEGLPTENREFIKNGVLKFIPYDSFYAAKYLDDKNLATGHSFGQGNPIPVSSAIEPGDRTFDEQLEEIDNGLYVKSFWYNRFTKKREGGLTGLTRNGLYHVKNGEIVGVVRNLRYTESFVNAFGPENIISLSKERRKFQLSNCPSMHLKNFTFTSVAHTKKQKE